MEIRVFETITYIWYVLFGVCIISSSAYTIYCMKKNINKFIIAYVTEGATIIINLLFMYLVDKNYVLYGDNKFSGLNRMGDWLGFLILIILTGIPVIITVACHVIYGIKRHKSNCAANAAT